MRRGVQKVTGLMEKFASVIAGFGSRTFSNADVRRQMPGVSRQNIATLTHAKAIKGFLKIIPPDRYRSVNPIRTTLPRGLVANAIWDVLPTSREDALPTAAIAKNAASHIMEADCTRKCVNVRSNAPTVLSRWHRDGYAARTKDGHRLLYYRAPGITERPVVLK